MGDTITPVLDKRKAWEVVEEEAPWCLQRNKITKHFRIINAEEKRRYLSTRSQEKAVQEYRDRLQGKTGGATPYNLPFPTLGGHTFWENVETQGAGPWVKDLAFSARPEFGQLGQRMPSPTSS